MRKGDTDLLQRGGHGDGRGARILVALIAGALIVQGLMRIWVAVGLLTSGIEGQFGGLVHWRVFDQFAGWVALMILAMADADAGRGRIFVRWILAAGLIGLVASLLWSDVSGRAIVEIAVAILLAIAALLVAGRQLLELARSMKNGLNIEQLWRGIAAQWVLLWVAAELTLRARFWREGVEAEEMARRLLFLVPVIGVAVNVMMAMGIRWWGATRAPEEKNGMRVRAWVVAMVMVNVGAILVVCGTVWSRGLGIAGAAVMVTSIGLYLVGFPKKAWRDGGTLVPIAFGALALGIAMMGGELLLQLQQNSVLEWYSASWRHLLASVELLWLLGMGNIALRRLVSKNVAAGARGAAFASTWLLLAGVIFTTGIFVLAIIDRETVRGLFAGAALQLAGVVVAAAVALRVGRNLKLLTTDH